jgi:hypothetical protein
VGWCFAMGYLEDWIPTYDCRVYGRSQHILKPW